MKQLTVGSLFSGIGGLDLGLERAGMKVIWQSEVDPYCCKVLAKHWPTIPNLGDVTQVDWSSVERPDVICGGYPCQPFSTAGKRAGADDSRHLWPHVRDAIRALRPAFAILENVAGHVTLGLSDVLADLASLGFDAEWSIVPASWVGAPHRRDRIFIIANANGERLERTEPLGLGLGLVAKCGDLRSEMADAAQLLSDGGHHHAGGGRQGTLTVPYVPQPRNGAGARRPICDWWATEPDVGRVAHGVPSRVDRLRGLGNAVVPQVAEYIGRQLLDAL